MSEQTPRAVSLVGPGRAGTAVAAALVARGWDVVAVAGRSVDAASVARAAARFGAPARDVADAGRGADVVVVATPDTVIADAAARLGPGLRRGALVVHLSGACTLDELHKLRLARPDVEVGSLHPLQSFPSPEVGVRRLPGSWCAVDGSASVERLAVALGMRPFRVEEGSRAAYHAAAVVASNHLVALVAQAARLVESVGVPSAALLPLARASLDNVALLGPERALTGPVARGDVDTVRRHLEALPPAERRAYRALADQARRLAGTDDPALVAVLEDDR